MTYKFVDISSLFERFAIDAFDIISGQRKIEEKYTGFFGDSPREIYAKVVQNKVETKIFVRCIDTHNYGFSDKEFQKSYDYYRYFLPLDALKELEKDYVSLDDLEVNKNAIDNFLWKLGKFSNQEDFSSSKIGTLVGSNENSLVGISDDGENIYGIFFRPLREGEGLTIKGIKVPVPDLNITPIPPLPREEVNKAIDNFDKEVEDYRDAVSVNQGKFLDKIEKDLREGSENLLALHANPPEVQYSVYKDKLYKYTGDFKYDDQINEIMEEFDWRIVVPMARIKYRDLESPKAKYPEDDLISMLKDDAEKVLIDLVQANCGRVSCGLFTAHNDGGCLSLDFTPESWEGSDNSDCRTESVELSKIEF